MCHISRSLAALAIAVLPAASLVVAVAGHQQPAFRATTRIVEVDAVVTGSDGRFIDDLTLADFEVTEDGRPQAIETLLLVAEGATTRPSRVFEGGPARVEPGPRVFVLVFDLEHLSPGSLKLLQPAAERFLDSGFRPGDVGGVVVEGAMAGGRLTSDREQLRRAIRAIKPRGDGRLRTLELREWPRLLNEFEAIRIVTNDTEVIRAAVLRACMDEPGLCDKGADPEPNVREKAARIVSAVRASAGRTLSTLGSLVTGLAAIEGAKTVVLLSEGFGTDETVAALERVIGLASRANARIYFVDGKGLNRTSGPGDITGPAVPDDPRPSPTAFPVAEDGPSGLASATGGFVVRNTNDFGSAFGQIGRDAGSYYVLGYRPLNEQFDGRYRRIQVSVKRKGLTVRARRGYLATPDAPVLARLTSGPAPGATGARSSGEAAALLELPPPLPGITDDLLRVGVAAGDLAAATPGATVPATAAAGAGREIRLRPDLGSRLAELGAEAASPTAETSPAPPDVLREARLGWERYEQGDVEGARERLSAAAASPAAPVWVHYTLGHAMLASWRPADAVISWELVRSRAPGFQPVYFDLADAYLQQNDLSKAVAVLRSAEDRWPIDVEVLNALGVVLARRGALDEAIHSFTRAAAVSPDDALAWYNLGRTYELRFHQSRRYASSSQTWVMNEDDRARAIANYERYLVKGGPFTSQAREALLRLGWKPK
jgi:VWFA-related protein